MRRRKGFSNASFAFFVFQANRSILMEEERARTETERAKAPLELATHQLQNLTYEKSQFVKAIKACNDSKSKYPDIEVVSEEEFFRDAPQDMKDSVLSNHSEHNVVLKRLNFELFQVSQNRICFCLLNRSWLLDVEASGVRKVFNYANAKQWP